MSRESRSERRPIPALRSWSAREVSPAGWWEPCPASWWSTTWEDGKASDTACSPPTPGTPSRCPSARTWPIAAAGNCGRTCSRRWGWQRPVWASSKRRARTRSTSPFLSPSWWPSSRWSAPSRVKGPAHAAALEVLRILDPGKCSRQGAIRVPIVLRRRLLAQCFMRSLFVIDLAKPIECTLLQRRALARWPCCLCFQRAVHPLMSAIVFRMASAGPLETNAEANPPDRQLGEAGDGLGAERYPVVRADHLG
jgi:hypothetical protein